MSIKANGNEEVSLLGKDRSDLEVSKELTATLGADVKSANGLINTGDESCSAAEKRQAFLQVMPVKLLEKGESVTRGSTKKTVYVVKEGAIKGYNVGREGNERFGGLYFAGTAFPLSVAYSGLSNVLNHHTAFTKQAAVYKVSQEDYITFLHSNPDVLKLEMRKLLVAHLGAVARLDALQHRMASDKLIHTLRYLATISGSGNGSPDALQIDIDLTHQDLADLTGLTRETTAVTMNKLRRQGFINYGKQLPYSLNVEKIDAEL